MNEWDVFLAIAALAGLFVTVGVPIIKLNTTIAKINTTLCMLQTQHTKDEEQNQAAHRRIWEHNDEQDAMLSEHRMRLHDLDGK